MDIYKARWENALRIAKAINNLISMGYMVFDNEGKHFKTPFTIKNGTISVKDGSCSFMFFENDKNYDHGLYTPIKEYSARFKKFTYIKPEYISRLTF